MAMDFGIHKVNEHSASANLDFSKVKSINIPEGSVSKITISNKIVWQKIDLSPYNVLPYLVATDASRAWIDLGIPYQNGCRAEYKVTFKNGANIFGVFYTTQRCRGYFETNKAVFNVGINVNNTVFPAVNGLTQNSVYTITCQADPNPNERKVSITVNGQTEDALVAKEYLNWDSSPHNMYLFAIHRTNTNERSWGTRVIHYFKYWDVNGNLLLDLIPVERKSDGKLGMFNKLNGQFLTNIADGTFYKEIPANASDYVEDDTDII